MSIATKWSHAEGLIGSSRQAEVRLSRYPDR
jgi:hypothetical protein